MRLDHDEFACNPPVLTSVSAPLKGHLVDNGPPPMVDEFAIAQELSRKIATSGIQNDAFLLANEDQLVANYTKWANQFPKIQPYFDVTCNACPWILTSLDQMNVKFSCQSKAEIHHVLRQDIDASKIIFAGQAKVGSHIKFANASKVPLMSFRSFGELKKFQTAEVESDLLLALQLPTGNPETDRQWLDLLNAAKDMGLNVVGVSFLAETSIPTPTKVTFNKMMALTKMAFAIGQSLGHTMKIVDVGLMNSFLSNSQEEFEKAVKKHLKGLDHKLIGHLGASFIENVFTCGAKIIGKRVGSYQNALVINDGIFNSFTRLRFDDDFSLEDIRPLRANRNNACKSMLLKQTKNKITFDLYGSSGDDMDILAQDFGIDQDVDEEDWLFFPMMGAFSYSLQSSMISVTLPKKLGNFRLFQAPGTSDDNDGNVEDSESFCLNVEQVLISEEDGMEVVFLDIQGNENDQQEKTCLDLFEELPNLACQDTTFWDEEFFSELR